MTSKNLRPPSSERGEGLDEYAKRATAADTPTNEELVTYDQLFKKRSKPSSHLRALAELSDEEIAADCPDPLRQLIERAGRILRRRSGLSEEEE